MNIQSAVILGIILVCVVLDVRYLNRQKGSCSCGGNCSACGGACSTCEKVCSGRKE